MRRLPGGMTEKGRQGSTLARKAKKLTTRVTYLEMAKRHFPAVPMPTRPRLALLRAENIPVSFYRYLYEQVGKPHHWTLRRRMDDKTLNRIINSQTTHIDVLYADGCAAGFFELNVSNLPETVEIAYFGICSNYTGMGLGKWFLFSAVEAAWNHDPQKLTVHTNTLDHPAALRLYQLAGFEPVGTGEEIVEAWES